MQLNYFLEIEFIEHVNKFAISQDIIKVVIITQYYIKAKYLYNKYLNYKYI